MRLRRIKELGKDSLVYGLGSMATKAVGFLMIPVYTAYLSPADLGVLALVNLFGALVGVCVGLGQHNAVFRFYFKQEEHRGRENVVSTFLGFALVMAVPAALLTLLARPVAVRLLGDASLSLLVVLVIGIHYLNLLEKVPLVVIRARRWTGRYVLYTLGRSLSTISLILLFVVALRRGPLGVLAGQALAALVFCALLYLLLRGVARLRIDPGILRDMLRFGVPLVPGYLLYFVLRFSNRFFLKIHASMDDVGLFSLGNRFGEVIVLMNTAVQMAWPIFLYGTERDTEARPLYARAMTYYIALAGLAGATIVLFIPEVYRLMVKNPAFQPSIDIVPVAVVTYIFMGVHVFGNVGINLREKTYLYIVIAATATIVAVVLNIALIPRHGIMGAAVATLLAYLVHASLTLFFSLRLYPIRYESRRIALLILTFTAATVTGRLLGPEGPVVAVAFKALLLLAGVPLALWTCGFFSPEEKRTIRRLLRSSSAR